jgi:hypothetical protein
MADGAAGSLVATFLRTGVLVNMVVDVSCVVCD